MKKTRFSETQIVSIPKQPRIYYDIKTIDAFFTFLLIGYMADRIPQQYRQNNL